MRNNYQTHTEIQREIKMCKIKTSRYACLRTHSCRSTLVFRLVFLAPEIPKILKAGKTKERKKQKTTTTKPEINKQKPHNTNSASWEILLIPSKLDA